MIVKKEIKIKPKKSVAKVEDNISDSKATVNKTKSNSNTKRNEFGDKDSF